MLQNKNKNKKKETTCQMSFIHYTYMWFVCFFFLILNVLEGVCFFMLLFNKHNYISSVLFGVYKECCLIILLINLNKKFKLGNTVSDYYIRNLPFVLVVSRPGRQSNLQSWLTFENPNFAEEYNRNYFLLCNFLTNSFSNNYFMNYLV